MTSPAVRAPIQLMPHQKTAVDFLNNHNFGAVWVDIGGGKTLTTLTSLMTTRPEGHILIIAPLAIARSVWIDEIEDWGFPIRTKSLIVDEQDRQLSPAARLQRFKEVLTDPPTVYFINQDLLTQPSHAKHKLVPVAAPSANTTLSPDALAMHQLLVHLGPTPSAELVEQFRAMVQTNTGSKKPPAKSKVNALVKELKKAQLIENKTFPCDACEGVGCPNCQFGLIDQMPVQKMLWTDGVTRDTITWPFQTVIIDEAQEFKSHAAQRFKALAAVRPAITRFIQLTGTPTPNGYHDLWAQMYLLDQGQALGENITAFRDRWFTAKMVPGTNTPASWIPNPGAEQEIQAAIKHLVISAENKSLNLGDPIINDVKVTLPAHLMQAYKDFKRDLVIDVVNEAANQRTADAFSAWFTSATEPEADAVRAEVKNKVDNGMDFDEAYDIAFNVHRHQFAKDPNEEMVKTVIAQNQAVLTSKLMQFASGTLYTSDPDDPSTKGDYQILHDEKIEMVKYILRNNGGSPALLSYHFRSDQEQLERQLKQSGFNVEVFDGSREMIHRWNTKQIQVMLLHPASAGPGLNLQKGGHTLIWYTLPFSLKHYQQLNGRLHRTGQSQQVTIHRLMTRGTQDDRMPTVLLDKQNTQDGLLRSVDADQLMYEALQAELSEDLNELWATSRL